MWQVRYTPRPFSFPLSLRQRRRLLGLGIRGARILFLVLVVISGLGVGLAGPLNRLIWQQSPTVIVVSGLTARLTSRAPATAGCSSSWIGKHLHY
jgi:hypothetical protein